MKIRYTGFRFLRVWIGLIIVSGMLTTYDASAHTANRTVASPGTIWIPAPNTTWQLQLTGLPVDTSIDAQVYDIDLFDTLTATVALLHTTGKKAVCYMSAGSWEDWRPDQGQFPPIVKGNNNGWPGEKWLDIRRIDILGPIMEARLDLCAAKGFDAVDPDNIDGYSNNTGFPLTYQDQLMYNRYLSAAAHARGLSIGLKNDLDQIRDLLPYFDWALNEQCFQYQECGALTLFVDAGKAVFNLEYNLSIAQFCPQAIAMGFNSMKKHLNLDVYREACSNSAATATRTSSATATPSTTRSSTSTQQSTRTPILATATPAQPSFTPVPPTAISTSTMMPVGTPTIAPTVDVGCNIQYSDVVPTDYFYVAVRYLSCNGAISGYTDGTFRPYNNVTRSQVAKVVVLAADVPINVAGGPHFGDVPESNQFYRYVESAYNSGLMSGYNDGTFRPYNDITRGQLCKAITLAKGWTLIRPTEPSFTDVGVSHAFYTYIETAASKVIIVGYNNGTFRPGANSTRGQISKVVHLAVTQP